MALLQSVLQRIATDRRMPGGERHSNRHSLILHGRAAPRQNMYSFSERRQYHANAIYDDASVLDINMSTIRNHSCCVSHSASSMVITHSCRRRGHCYTA